MSVPWPLETHGQILVVQDGLNDLQYIVRVLREHGFTAHAVSEAVAALAFVRDTVPDLILLDPNLPDLDGYELCRRFKVDVRTRHVPTVVLSASSQPLDKVRAFATGAVDYISKPFHEEEALARIRTHLSLRRVMAGLVATKKQAEEENLAKSRLLAKISHELRTPLSAILGHAQILETAGTPDERQRRSIGAIQEGGDCLLRLIDDILAFARIEADKMQIVPAPASLTTMLRFVGREIGMKARPKGLRFECEMRDELPVQVMVDEKRLSQVLLNLLDNAVKFTVSGRVTLRTQTLPGSNDVAVRLRFTVEDTGPGIAAGDIATIFQPFGQVCDVAQRAGGVGLGLAISRRLVRMMGSDILVQSKFGVGSRFWFDLRLPLARPHAASTSDRCAISGYEGPRKTILIVDDAAVNRDMAANFLAYAGFQTVEARDGREALERVREDKPDLVIMDLRMPTMTGLDATRLLRKNPASASLPIIAVSASSSQTDRSGALAAGADAFLPKPLDFNELFEHVGSALRLNWTRDACTTVPG